MDPQPPVFISLGKFGDVILMLPAFKAMYDRTGLKPKVIIAKQFSNVLEGVSYVDPVVLDIDWQDVPKAVTLAKLQFSTPVVPCWWHDKTLEPEKVEGGLVLRVHGKEWSVDQTKYPNFMASMYLRSGFSVAEMMELPLVFDQRDKDREKQLLQTFTATDKRPLLLLNFSGEASPFALVPEVMQHIQPYRTRFNIVRLDNLRAQRIYDLLGLIDNAAGLITIDTATLHLAHASKTPYIAFTRDGWSGSVPRGNCALDIKYSQTMQRLDAMKNVLEQWLQPKVARPVVGISPPPAPKRKCWMLERPRIPLKNVTLWGCCWSSDRDMHTKTMRVLRYCAKLFDFERVLFMAYMPPPKNWGYDFVQVPEMNMNGWNIFVNNIVPRYIDSEFAMSIHEDGFPVRPDLWTSQFLDYDYIGAPWQDGVVGNGGFNIESRRMMREKMNLPATFNPVIASDMYVCRTHRTALEKKGVTFAPTEVAVEFSTELTGAKWPSFGFHGRRFQQPKYQLGWQLIAESEQ